MLPTKKIAKPWRKNLRNRGARVSSSPISGQPIEITLTGIGLANRGANFLPVAAGSKVAQFRVLAAVLATLIATCSIPQFPVAAHKLFIYIASMTQRPVKIYCEATETCHGL